MKNNVSSYGVLSNPTPSKVRDLQLGIAISQTSYELNNGFGVRPGMKLGFLEDSALAGTPGARPLKVSIPDGFIVADTFIDRKTGVDALIAVNKATGEIVIGLTGTNGFGNDRPDTKQDIINLGVGQANSLYENVRFQETISAIKRSLEDSGLSPRVLIAGQSLGGGVATTLGMLLVYGNPRLDRSRLNGINFAAEQIAVVSVNGFGSEYSAKAAGFTPDQTSDFYARASLDRIVVRNPIDDTYDLVSQLGGRFGGTNWILNVEISRSVPDIHRMNFGVAEGLDNVYGDLTRISSGEVPLLNHETITRNAFFLDSMIPVANNAVSLTWASYVALLFANPGEGAASISAGLHRFAGFPKPLADAFGVIGEVVARALPIAHAAQAIRFLLGGYVAGQIIGSSDSALPTFDVVAAFGPVQDGWIRREVFASHSRVPEFVIDRNPQTLVEVIRRIDGRSVETHPDGTRIETHPEYGIAALQPDGSGALFLKSFDAETGEFRSATVPIPRGASLDLKEEGWQVTRPIDSWQTTFESTLYSGPTVVTVEHELQRGLDGKPTDKIVSSRSISRSLANSSAVAAEVPGFRQYMVNVGPGHVQFVLRDDDRRTIQTIDIVTNDWKSETTHRDGQGQITKRVIIEQLHADATRTLIQGMDCVAVESRVVQRYRRDGDLFELEDYIDHAEGVRVLTVRDSQGFIQKAEAVPLNETPAEYMTAVRDQLHDDIADFLTALRQKDTAGLLLSTARIALDYARSQGAVTAQYDAFVGGVANGLALVQSLRSLQSGDALAKAGGIVGLLNSTNYFATKMTGAGYLSSAQTAALSQIGAMLSIANLANLGKMIESGQIGSAGATVISAMNGISYLAGTSSALMGAGALIAINPIVFVIGAFAFDELLGEDPPPPPPQGLAEFFRQADGRLGYWISESNPLGENILRRQLDQLLPTLESQLAQANASINDADHQLHLVATRMPSIQISGWPSREGNGEANYFFVLKQQDPMRDDPVYVGVSRLDLVRLYAETLLLPEALVQQWELDHLRAKFGSDEAHWQTEGAWLRGRSPTEQQRSQLQAAFNQATGRWETASKLSLAMSSVSDIMGSRGNVTSMTLIDAAAEKARLQREAAREVVEAFNVIHPLDPLQAARATPEQEAEFARTRSAKDVVALQWHRVLAIDFGNDGVQLIDLPGHVGHDLDSLRTQRVARFDIDGDGFGEATQWIAPADAILGIDRSGNSLIDTGNELFNGPDIPFDQRGLAALAYYDANRDGRITAADPVYRQLRLWIDLDGDGSAGQLEVFDLQMRSAVLGFSGTPTASMAGMAIEAIDLAAASVTFADGQRSALVQQDLLAHVAGVRIASDAATGNLNVLYESGLRENFITLVEDMGALQALQSTTLPAARRAELEALAARYGLNPHSADFAAIVQGLRTTGQNLGSEDTVIYFGDDDVWVDPAVRERLAAMRVSFRKLGGPDVSLAGDAQLVRVGQPVVAQSVKPDGAFDDRWVPGRQVREADILSDAMPHDPTPATSAERQAVPGDVTSLMLATKGAQAGGLVTRQASISGDPAQTGTDTAPAYVLTSGAAATPLGALTIAANEDELLVVGIAHLLQDARLHMATSDPAVHLRLVGIRGVSMGRVDLDEDQGLIRFRPREHHAGEAGFVYVLADHQGRLYERAVQVRLAEVNDAPSVAGESILSQEDVPLLIDTRALLANDRDVEGDALAVTGIARVVLGRAELLANGTIHYTPPSDMYGVTDVLEYIVSDSRGASAVGRVRIELAGIDDAPTVVAERLIHAREDQRLLISPHLLLRNDIDPDADARLGSRPLRIATVGAAEHGSVHIERDGQIVFVPDANFNGEAAFSYTVMDESGLATTGRAWIRIDPVNDAPLAAGEQIAGIEDETLVIDTALLLKNEFDADIERGEQQALSVVALDDVSGGTAALRDGLIRFTPQADHAGSARFRYLVSDGRGGFAQATVDITLAPVNDAPRLVPLRFQGTEDTELVLPASRLLEGASDVDGDVAALRLLSVRSLDGGTVTLAGGQLRFVPAENFAGVARISYTVADGEGACTEGLALVDINGVNDAPIRVADVRLEPVADEDQEIRIAESAMLRLFADADGDPLSLVTRSLAVDAPGDRVQFDDVRRELVFRGAPNANGVRKIRFAVTDGQAVTPGVLEVRLRPVNDAPTVSAVGFQMLEDGGETNPTKSAWSYLSHDLLLSGASDVDGDALTIARVSGARTTGVGDTQPVDLVNDPALRRIGIRAPLNYTGTIEFQFVVTDGKGGETTQAAVGMVAAVNDVPLLTVQQIGAGTAYVGRALTNVSTWQISAWDPDDKGQTRLAVERNSLRGSASLGAPSTANDPRGGTLTVAAISTNSGIGNAITSETAWFSATDSLGATSQISISFVGRYNTDPIVIDFDRDGLRFIDLEHSRATLEVDGVARRTAWIGPNEGILAYDADDDGRIRRLDEIAFGTHVGQPAISDLQALQHPIFDQNQDGVFDAADEKWASFLVWRDRNGNGVSDDGELQSMAEAGMKALFLNANVLNRAEGADVRVRGYTRALMMDGSLRQAADVWLRLDMPQEGDATEPDPSMQQVTQLGNDQLASLLRQLADAPRQGNRPPLVYGYLPTQHAEEGQAFRLEIAPNFFIDADADDPLRIDAIRADGSPLPDWLHFDGDRLAFSGKPAMSDAGVLQLALVATDREGASSRVTFTLVSNQINRAPEVATPLEVIYWQTSEEVRYRLPASLFHDPNGDPLTIRVVQADGAPLPRWLRFDPETRSLVGYADAPDLENPLPISITATDGMGLSVTMVTRLVSAQADIRDNDFLTGDAGGGWPWSAEGNDLLRSHLPALPAPFGRDLASSDDRFLVDGDEYSEGVGLPGDDWIVTAQVAAQGSEQAFTPAGKVDPAFIGLLPAFSSRFDGGAEDRRFNAGWLEAEMVGRDDLDVLTSGRYNREVFGDAGNGGLVEGAGVGYVHTDSSDDRYVSPSYLKPDVIGDMPGSDAHSSENIAMLGQLTVFRAGIDSRIGVDCTGSPLAIADFFDSGGGVASDIGMEWIRITGGHDNSTALLMGAVMTPVSTSFPGATSR